MIPTRTSQEMYPLVEQWQQSNLTQKEFSAQHQITPHAFGYWVNKYRKEHEQKKASTPTSGSFIALTAQTTAGVEVVFPTGVMIRFSHEVPVSYLSQLLSACSH